MALHGKQKYGVHPYSKHLLDVTYYYGVLFKETESSKILCAGHDVLEDTFVGYADLREMGMTINEVITLQHLTHDSEFETYEEYISHFEHEHIARRIKIADSTANFMASVKERRSSGIVKYSENLRKLWGWESKYCSE